MPGVGPAEVDVVEGHGTGTRLGDPIEALALFRLMGRGAVRIVRCGWGR